MIRTAPDVAVRQANAIHANTRNTTGQRVSDWFTRKNLWARLFACAMCATRTLDTLKNG